MQNLSLILLRRLVNAIDALVASRVNAVPVLVVNLVVLVENDVLSDIAVGTAILSHKRARTPVILDFTVNRLDCRPADRADIGHIAIRMQMQRRSA